MNRPGTVPWPDEVARDYCAKGYWRNRPLGAYLWEWADRFRSRTAVVDGDHRLSYRELAERSDALAEGLARSGVRKGDTILVQLPNCWEFVVVLLACARLGAAPVLALMPHREHELSYLAELAEVAAIVVRDEWRGYEHQQLAATVAADTPSAATVMVVGDHVYPEHVDLRSLMRQADEVAARKHRLDAAPPDPRDVLLFLLSGGTTGLPKVIARTHNDYEYNARRSGEVCEFHADTVYLAALPIAHNFALGSPGALATLMNGGMVVLLPSPEPRAAFAEIEREQVNVTSVVPAVAQRWLDALPSASDDLASLQVIQIGGSVLPDGMVRSLITGFDCQVQQVFGMAEGLLNYTRLHDPYDVVTETQGRPICADDELLVVDEQDSPLLPGTPGELLTRGPYTPRGYFAAPQHNARAFTADGWYRTGDIVRITPEGNLSVTGRVKDQINRGGEKIAAVELEDLARDLLPQVLDAAAVAQTHAELGEAVCMCVVLRPGSELSLAELQEAFERKGVARFKFPERLAIFSAFPQTAIGKIDKKQLRLSVDHLLDESFAADSPQTSRQAH
ncbi:(2,3-dihydroxybenzoyl)adenylate synthase [Salinactinospora qingdaonensis]|uniref:(2,3-dihydroxybenzoyl)adenylate synthase n=1 Tax=Salinactinospora qingdaonensis TaxID=702744 RepID=A0ABP7FWJ8_9ACTN